MGGKTQGLACRGKRGVARSSLAKLPAPPAAGWEDGRKASSQREAAGDAPRSERNCQICGAQRTFRSSYTAVLAKHPPFAEWTGRRKARPVAGSGKGSTPACVKSSIPPWQQGEFAAKRQAMPLVRVEFPRCLLYGGVARSPGHVTKSGFSSCLLPDGRAAENPASNAGSGGRCASFRAELPSMRRSANFPQ